MKTKEIEAVKQASTINTAGLTPGDMAKVETLETMLEDAKQETEVQPAILAFGKHRVNVEVLTKALSDAYAEACRMSKIAESKGLGRIAKNMTGGGTLIPTPAIINELFTLGEFGVKTDKKSAVRRDALKGLNMLVDGLVLLGVSKRS